MHALIAGTNNDQVKTFDLRSNTGTTKHTKINVKMSANIQKHIYDISFSKKIDQIRTRHFQDKVSFDT